MISAPSDHVTRAIQNVLLTRNPTQTKLQGLESDMRNILDRTDLHDDVKMNLYGHTLQKYLQYENSRKTEPFSVKMSTPARKTTETAETVETRDDATTQQTEAPTSDVDQTSHILKSVPKTFHRRAKLLLDKLKQNDVMTWNKNDELIYRGNLVKGSNIVDLVNDTLREKRGFNPLGWQYFARGLAKSNAPESIIGNESRRDVIRQIKQSDESEKRLLPSLIGIETTPKKRKTVLPTPKKPKKRIRWETL